MVPTNSVRIYNVLIVSLIIAALAVLPFLVSCGGGSGDGEDDNTSGDISGEWEITIIPDPHTLTGSTDTCNIHNQSTQVYTISRADDQVTITTPDGGTLNGTMTNDICTFSGQFIEGADTISIDGQITFSGSSLSGSGTFRWEEGTRYCQWEQDYVGSRSSNDDCISVAQGGWEFEWTYRGTTILKFTDGDLTQSGCNVSYDDDNIFSGPLEGNQWSGENAANKFKFSGTFSGSPATSFSGTYEDTSGTGFIGTMHGVHGTLR
jgi:hypothetical protein